MRVLPSAGHRQVPLHLRLMKTLQVEMLPQAIFVVEPDSRGEGK